MKLLKSPKVDHFDFAILGLGYESRSIFAYEKYKEIIDDCLVLGYESNQDVLFYQYNKEFYSDTKIVESSCSNVIHNLNDEIQKINKLDNPRVLLDITVMTRHRLSLILNFLIKNLKSGGSITICYIASKYVCPPIEMQPVKKVGPLIDELSGGLGNLSFSTTAVFGLGYEQSKALGIYNYLEPDNSFCFIPRSLNPEFESDVISNNKSLLSSIPSDQIFNYSVYSPYDIYVDMKSLVISLCETSRVVIVPLGPKILSAISLIVGVELSPFLSVWRVSSLHSEEPVDRQADREVLLSIDL